MTGELEKHVVDDQTEPVSAKGFTTQRPNLISGQKIGGTSEAVNLPLDTISLLLPGRDKPTVFRDKLLITIGRRDDNNSWRPDIDLMDQYGTLMGVSRHHAEISMEGGQFFIKDMDSTNGSWLNTRKLIPGRGYALTNGDQVRLGELLMLVYLSSSKLPSRSKKTTTPTDDVCTLHLVDLSRATEDFEGGIPPHYLTNTISVYVHALSELQHILRKLRDEEAQPVRVQSIQKDDVRHSIRVDLTNATEVVSFLRDPLPRFMEAWLLEQGAEEVTSDEMAEAAANHLLEERVFKFLNDKREEFIQKLARPIRFILKSDLRISTYDKGQKS